MRYCECLVYDNQAKLKFPRVITGILSIMDEVIINRRVPISSRHLHKGLERKLLEEIKRTTDGECSSEYGYIMEILSLGDVGIGEVAPGTLENVFPVSFLARVIKPKSGSEVDGIVWKVCEDGIFVSVADKFKVMVSEDEFDELGYGTHPDGYEKDGNIITVGSLVRIKIEHVRYECSKQLFSTIGTLVEESKENGPVGKCQR